MLIKAVVVLLFSVSFFLATGVFADTAVPEARPGTKAYKRLLELFAQAKIPENNARWGEYGLINGSGEFVLLYAGPKPNRGQLGFQWNGKYYQIPLHFSEIGNIQEFTYNENGRAGIYLHVQGFRVNPNTDMPDHVTAVIRFARLDGSPLPSLNYHEFVEPGVTPEYHWFYPAINPRPITFVSFAPSTSRPPEWYSFSALLPGSYAYNRTKYFLEEAAKTGSTYLYYTYAFHKVEGEMVGISDGTNQHLEVRARDKYFIFPMDYLYTENMNLFTREKGKDGGMYMIQRGFRHNSSTNAVEEVTTKIRVADLDGDVPSTLVYEESTVPAVKANHSFIFEHDW
jgi:hypothetical protein